MELELKQVRNTLIVRIEGELDMLAADYLLNISQLFSGIPPVAMYSPVLLVSPVPTSVTASLQGV
jgi:hypothetical protein